MAFSEGELTRSAALPWAPFPDAPGVRFKLLDTDPKVGGFSVLLRVEPDADLVLYRHHGGSEWFVVDGVEPVRRGLYWQRRATHLGPIPRVAGPTTFFWIAYGPWQVCEPTGRPGTRVIEIRTLGRAARASDPATAASR